MALGTTGAYAALAAGPLADIGSLTRVLLVHVATIVVATPLAATALGWLIAGREPANLGRKPLD